MFFYTSTAPREKRYHSKYKKVLYLEPPTNGSKTVRTRVTTIVPPPSPPEPPVEFLPEPIHMPMPSPSPEPPVMVMPPPPPPPPPQHYHQPMPPYPVSEVDDDESIDVIAVDVDPPRARSSKSSKSSSSSSSSSNSSARSSRSSRSSHTSRSYNSHRHGHSCEREVYVERERLVPVHVPYPVPVQDEKNDYDTFRYVEAPRRFEPRRRSSGESDDRQIIIEDHRQRRYIRD